MQFPRYASPVTLSSYRSNSKSDLSNFDKWVCKNQSSIKPIMKITVTDGDRFSHFDVEENEEIENIKALIQAETNVPCERQLILYLGKQLQGRERLNQLGIVDGDILELRVAVPKAHSQQGGMSIADMIKKFDQDKGSLNFRFPEKKVQDFLPSAQETYRELKDDHHRLSELAAVQPQIATLVINGDVQGLAHFMKKKHDEKVQKLIDSEKKFIELSKDPMNPQYQKMLEERIHQQNIDENLEFAQEYVPEVFGHINMLYINASINKVPIQAFVDSGAQSTIMSQALAERCGLMRLMDKRAAGRAMGVGSCKILGKIHAAEIEIEKKFITCSFTVIENNGTEFLLGLDMLKRFSCIIDLKKNQLNFQDGLIVTKFLADADIKKNSRQPSKEELEAKLNKITSLGFSKDEAIKALKNCNYNEEVASNMLMQAKYGK